MSEKNSDLKICAIGLDHLGYKLRPKSFDGPDFRIDFLTKDEALASNLEYDGMIILNGIFERFSSIPDKDGPRMAVQSDPDQLRKMEAKVTHQLDRGRWVCFLVDEILDRINEDHPKVRATVVNDTDLCKRVLNKFNIQRTTIQSAGSLEVKNPAFLSYAQNFAHPKTVFSAPKDLSVRELMSCSSGTTSFVLANQLFFLPFFKSYSKAAEVSVPVVDIFQAILAYFENPNAQIEDASNEIPSWAEAFAFKSEQKIVDEQKSLKLRIEQLKGDLQIFKKFKNLLTQTGSNLSSSVEFVLKEFFGFKLKTEQNSIRVENEKGEFVAVVYTTSCQGIPHRSHINEVDNIRENLKLNHSHLGILVINDSLEANSIEEKESLILTEDVLKHAERQNVYLFRSIDLLKCLKSWEDLGLKERQEKWLELLKTRKAPGIELQSLTKASGS